MVKRTEKKIAADVEERFLVQCLRRLNSADQRYIFTLIADLVSHGLVASSRRKGAPSRA